jgi:hypothetical protein
MDIIKDAYDKVVDIICEGRKYLRGMLPRFKILTNAYIALIDGNLWDHFIEEDDKEKIRTDAARVNEISGLDDDPVSVYDAFRAYKEQNKKVVNQALLENIDTFKSEINFIHEVGSIIEDMGITEDVVNQFQQMNRLKR